VVWGHVTCDAISLKTLLYLGKANLTPEEVVSVAPGLLRKSTLPYLILLNQIIFKFNANSPFFPIFLMAVCCNFL